MMKPVAFLLTLFALIPLPVQAANYELGVPFPMTCTGLLHTYSGAGITTYALEPVPEYPNRPDEDPNDPSRGTHCSASIASTKPSVDAPLGRDAIRRLLATPAATSSPTMVTTREPSRLIWGIAIFRIRRAIPPWRRGGSRSFFETKSAAGYHFTLLVPWNLLQLLLPQFKSRRIIGA